MSREMEARRLAGSRKKKQHLPLRALGGWALLTNGFVTLLLVIGYTLTGGNAPPFPIAGAAGSALLLLGCPP